MVKSHKHCVNYFFALIAHANATSKLCPVLSSIILSSILLMTALHLSQVPLDQGDSPAVVVTYLFKVSLTSHISSLLNSQPLSVRYAKDVYPMSDDFLYHCIFFFSFITVALQYFVAKSIIRRMF